MKRSSLLFGLFACGLFACAAEPNAVLDVRMRLPTDLEGRSIANVQVGTIDDDFGELWGSDPIAFDLEQIDGGCNVTFSVEAPTPRSDRAPLEELRIKVWFCPRSQPSCTEDSDAPIWRITLARPLYAGERTEWVLGSDELLECSPFTRGSQLPEAPGSRFSLDVDRCQIRGCVDGFAAAGRDFCVDPERTVHPCD